MRDLEKVVGRSKYFSAVCILAMIIIFVVIQLSPHSELLWPLFLMILCIVVVLAGIADLICGYLNYIIDTKKHGNKEISYEKEIDGIT